MYPVYTCVAYVTISIALTVWVARTLFRHGQIFLVEAFGHNEALATSVNHLLVVGFYLINVGYVTLALSYGRKPIDLQESIEFLSWKIGLVLVVLGFMHFFNLAIFSDMRKRALNRAQHSDRHALVPAVRPDAPPVVPEGVNPTA